MAVRGRRPVCLVGAGEDFCGGAATGADGAVHVAVPHVGGFGAGPVDAADGRGERLAILGRARPRRGGHWP